MIMAPAVTPPPAAFPRSHSTSDLLTSRSGSSSPQQEALSVSGFDLPSFNDDFELDISLLSNARAAAASNAGEIERPPKARSRLSLARARTSSFIERPRSWFPPSKTARESSVEVSPKRPIAPLPRSDQLETASKTQNAKPLESVPAVAESFASFAKRSWISSSRSPSPRGRLAPGPKNVAADGADGVSRKSNRTRIRSDRPADRPVSKRDVDSSKTTPGALTRASSYFSKLRENKPVDSTNLNDPSHAQSDNSCASSTISTAPPATDSTDTTTSQSASCDSNAATTDDSSGDLPTHVRDVLWSSFKTLELEFKLFLVKQIPQRMQQFQSTLLPFLKATMFHGSVKVLSPEDVDRRATILNKWWNVALDMLDNQGTNAVSRADRSVLLETIAIIMMRPEWRQTSTCLLPLTERPHRNAARPRSWTDTSGSTISSGQLDFLAESAEHNIRTMFLANLMRQIVFVIDKLSLRAAPLDLVNLAGKTFAYAFFFAPGVADVAVRLWGLTPELIRRTSDELGLPRKRTTHSEDLAALFPPAMAGLQWSSPKAMWETIKVVPPMSMLIARVPWTGPWVSRWKGHGTDLFFIFCKYYHVLADQFMPPDLSLAQKAACPGFVLVQAQLLSIMDTSLHRQNAPRGPFGGPMDSSYVADASAMLPLPASDMNQRTSESRLIALLKDFLSDDSPDFSGAKCTFAGAFTSMLEAATRKISQFDSSACFTLCDFLEEVLTTYGEFENGKESESYINWTFWVEVWKKIMASFNTMSEIRTLSFIFSIWDTIVRDPQRKKLICLDWLISDATFNTYFNHWCPMVRAYYHRLLCWRICRDEGKPIAVDAEIFFAASNRLRTAWAHYLYMKDDAEKNGRPPPSTCPTLPTPNKKFVIIRQHLYEPQPGYLVGFDSFARPKSSDKLPASMTIRDADGPRSEAKKRWSIIDKVFSLGSAGNVDTEAPSPGLARRPSWEDDFLAAGRMANNSRIHDGAAPPPPPPKQLPPTSPESSTFDASPEIEEPDYIFKFILAWQQPPVPSRNRVLTRPVLPAPAQARVRLRTRSDSGPPPSPSIPSPTRTFSGSSRMGLVQGARNASPLPSPIKVSPRPPRISLENDGDRDSLSADMNKDFFSLEADEQVKASSLNATPVQERAVEAVTKPSRPVGMFVQNAIYTGRSLAEWGAVVFEYNNFLERRRDEGVLGLSEVEVPLLAVEGFRKLAG
ncbi:hypothetical protein S7711_08067 [Stachybotrys chartarum IBT 7711]|uniref:DUF1765-domain-containing protein n=1 Tax=Stachybotrys chartarum (strain CBS 109288 / IBT 7711) TaxID=1280523 RepID=A0A084AHK9_STACB|nr:hypothetical protein S7711_08067 [Stachybotrys chartarum IBT 7711]